MAFHSPIDEAQWKLARKVYRGMRLNLRSLRQTHPPRNHSEALVLLAYKDEIRKFGEQLLKPYGKIRAELLNDLNKQVLSIFVLYSDVYNSSD